jgi:uncharacterized NAD(P)/FAD-binding protein YdhS
LQLLRTIAIVGGGFSGTVLAANLSRRAPATPTRLLLIEREHEVGCGLAYQPYVPAQRFLLNVTAGRMSATSAAPLEFLQYAEDLRERGALIIHAANIAACTAEGARLRVQFRVRGESESRALTVDHVINCTGPDYDLKRTRDPLWRGLLDAGLAVPDPLGLGVKTGPNGALFDVDGWSGPHLYYLGSMLRADHWEATAAAELRVHAEQLAIALTAQERSDAPVLRMAAP